MNDADMVRERINASVNHALNGKAEEALDRLLARLEARAEQAERERDTLLEALRPFAEKWNLHASQYLVLVADGEEQRVLPGSVVAEMISDIETARAALAAVSPPQEGEA